ncbi:MAG TPA: kelch repeat-containing protein [Pseudonocardiaceae bacterium]|nr:kelch repeat-containing protein [Pseudonocardiaceae bacterium]
MIRKTRTLTAALIAIIAAVGLGIVPAAGSTWPRPHSDPLRPPPPRVPTRLYKGPAGTKSPWTAVPTPFDADSMLLLTDGSVMVQQTETTNWWRLTPNDKGNYYDGTWSQLATMPNGYAPTYYASAVLPDGRVIVEGGEYNSGQETDTTQGAIYNPVTNTWTPVSPPSGSGWTLIGDAPSAVLANGTFMLGSCCSSSDALLNESTLTWTATGTGGAFNNEDGWSLLPDGDVLTVVASSSDSTQIYSPGTGAWTSAGNLPVPLSSGAEVGPQLLLPDGDVFAAGANGDSDIYDTGTGTWSAGPTFPVIGGQQYDIADGPSAVLPDGDLLLEASPGQQPPAHFFIYNGTTLTQVADSPNANLQPSFTGRMLVLPSGRILFDDYGSLELYYDNGAPPAAWTPQITKAPTRLHTGTAYTVSGIQLNGLTEGSAYGDDYQSATNYPLVRITNDKTGDVSYARTFGMTSMSVAPGTQSAANFRLPARIETGPSTLVVVANGIASAPVKVWVQ